MKIRVLLFAALLVAGCGEKEPVSETTAAFAQEEPLVDKSPLDIKAIPALAAKLREKVEERRPPEGGFFVKGTDTPYSGVYYEVERVSSDGEEIYMVANIKDGQFEGTATAYRPDGSQVGEVEFRDGEEGPWKFWNSKGEEVETMEEALK